MLHELLRLKITDSDVLVPVDIVAGLLVVWALVVRPWSLPRFLVRIAAMGVGAVVGLGLVWWFGDVQDAFGVAFTPITRMWVAFAVAGIALFLTVAVQGGWGRRVVALGAACAVVLAAGLGVNVDFGFYKDIQQALVTNPYPYKDLPVLATGPTTRPAVDPSGWHAPAGMPAKGEAISVRIPATVSHFHARKAVVWLPPAARTAHPPTLPVIVALSGQPGEPSDLFQTGDMGKFLDRYAAAHGGLAPIVVSPDQLGAPNRNPMCVDSRRLGRSETYVMTDTVDWIRKHLPKDGSVTVTDVTSSRSVLNLVGPRSRDVLQAVVEEDVSNEAFKFASSKLLHLGYAEVLASRVTYVGELGYELHVPMECTAHVYDALWEAGQKHGIINAG